MASFSFGTTPDYGAPRCAAVSVCYRLFLAFRPHLREQNYIADACAVGQQHHQPVNSKAGTRGRRQTVLERTDIVGVVIHRLRVARFLAPSLLLEARRLVLRVVQLGEAV